MLWRIRGGGAKLLSSTQSIYEEDLGIDTREGQGQNQKAEKITYFQTSDTMSPSFFHQNLFSTRLFLTNSLFGLKFSEQQSLT